MSTKEQERNTLEKIKKMVAELGENSYLASAFDGAFDLAEQNIEDDAAYTTQYYIDETNRLITQERKAKEELAKTTEMLLAVQEAHRATTENFDATIERAKGYANTIDDLKAALEDKEAEIIKLKAKLYDYITIPA